MKLESKISIVLPVYNVEKYVQRCLNSIAGQTLTDGVECIIVDDCGTDRSIEIIKFFIKDYCGNISFKLLHHDNNRGLSAARNTGIEEAKGEYVYFMDSDDYFYSNDSLEKLWTLTKTHEDVDLVQGNFYIEEVSDITFKKDSFPSFTENKSWICAAMATLRIPESACNRLIKRRVIVDNNVYFKEGWIQEDTLWSYCLHNYIDSIAFCFEPTYFYAYNTSSIMHSSGNEKEANAFIRILNVVYQKLQAETVYSYDVKFLEMMAERAERANGEGVYTSIIPYNKLVLRTIFKINSIGNKSKILGLKYACNLVVLPLRYIACNKYFFS